MSKPNYQEYLFFILALLAVLFIQGAIPFVLAPTLGQAVWTTGFSHSFANGGLLEVYAHNIGAPEPAPIAFGLAGAWPASLFIRLGLHAADAYAAMAAIWLSVAFGSAYAIARHFQATGYHSTIAAVCWLTMPAIWAHAGYSMLSLGIGLLSFYFLVTIRLIDSLRNGRKITKWSFLYPIACGISVFMDGYSFMMFAVGSSIIIGLQWVACEGWRVRRIWLFNIFPVHAFSFALSYLLYCAYIGQPSFDAQSIDFFRGWGLDISFMAIPAMGTHWLADILGWSVPRNDKLYWGDASVWTTTFSLPLMAAAVWAAVKSMPQRNWAMVLCVTSLFGFYMALGPSLKINSMKPPQAVTERLMEERYAVAPTGSEWVSKKVPGFNVMRASYRWAALGMFCAWVILILALSQHNKRPVIFGALVLTLMVSVFNIPSPVAKWKSNVDHRNMFFQLDQDVLMPLSKDLVPGERVVFLPWGNDFLVNYLASNIGVKAYNIGGDKNLQMARESWPPIIRGFPMAAVDEVFPDRILQLLFKNEADAVILPFIDMLWAAHAWPNQSGGLREQLKPVIDKLTLSGLVDLAGNENYVVVRIKKQGTLSSHGTLIPFTKPGLCFPPHCLRVSRFNKSTRSLSGRVIDGVVYSTGDDGFLLFGPYQPMSPGIYSLVLYGSSESSFGAWLDVVSEKGKVAHGKWKISSAGYPAGVLFKGFVEISKFAKDVEVRVRSGANDKILITGYELGPTSSRAVVP